MKLFDQLDFTGGIDAEYDRIKIPRNSVPLLLNGRIRDGNIQPVKRHVKDLNIPDGVYQNLITVGNYLVAFISGLVYYKDIFAEGPWQTISSWTPLSTTADEVYVTLIPVGTNYMEVSGDPKAADVTFNPQIAQTLQGLFISDGINQPRILYGDLSWEILNTYSQWSINNPEYVPLCQNLVVSGVKAFCISQDRKKIYQSVSGRYTDFVVNRTVDGDKGGDADSLAYAVDFNDLTALQPTQQGGLLASTLYATYLLLPSDLYLFNEPVLSVGDPAFPIGAVNWKSYASILGDVAFIAQSGIHSINVSMQVNRESNNNPFSRSISKYLIRPQSNTCATNFDDYALFSVDTTYGRGVFVYDTLAERFVSLDTGFGTVKRFAAYKAGGVNKLYFITTDNELYEAYADTQNQVTRVLLGDFAYFNDGVRHQVVCENLYLWFNNLGLGDTLRLGYYADGELIEDAELVVDSNNISNQPPVSSPFVDQPNILCLKCGVPPREAAAISVWLEWSADMELVGISVDGSTTPIVQPPSIMLKSVELETFVVLANPDIYTIAATGTSLAEVSGLITNEYYYAAGTANIGSATVTDNIFKANLSRCKLSGSLYNVHDYRDLYLQALREPGISNTILTLGNNTDGTEVGWDKLAALMGVKTIQGANSYKDLDVALSSWYKRRERYYMIRTDLVEFFVISGGWNSANIGLDSSGNPTGTSTEIDGYTSSSRQAAWLRYWVTRSTRPFKVVLIGYPLYTDETTMYPGFAPLRWPFKKWGVDLVLSLCPGVYERFYIGGFPYINLGLGGTTNSFKPASRSVRRYNDSTGYLAVTPRTFSLDISFKDANGDVVDATTIYPR